ncbi:MAG: sulfate adenylyltransferase subunit CysN [Alphaproteobacteria bacterium]|nr:sulfate adenylyltransferase subunit CysN [Alphaproteobacteria bacterium]
MTEGAATASEDIEAYLRAHQHKSLLRFITCGSVDDGKSTLIGRLLYDTKMVFEDQLAALESDSRKMGTQGEAIDFALLVDGLAAEREQGITIDVAYRYFATDNRKYIVADTPGHEQYTRNMATGASTADVAIILIDARKGVLTQTRRHSFIVSLMGIRHVVLAVNKMDLTGFDRAVFEAIEADYRAFAEALDFARITCIPVSALGGDNVMTRSDAMPWYEGPSLMDYLETVEVENRLQEKPFRFPVQWVNRPNLDFRGFSGRIAAGRVAPGMEVRILPSARTSRVKAIVTADGDLPEAAAGQSVTLTLEDEVDVSRGDMICDASRPAELTDQFEGHLIWMGDEPMLPGRPYLMKTGALTLPVTVTRLKHAVNVNTMEEQAAKRLELNEIGVCNFSTERPFPFDAFRDIQETGCFVLIDRFSNATVGAGTIHFALRRASNVHWQSLDIDKKTRAELMGQKPRCVWLTGLSGAGKSTIANLVEKKLFALGRYTYTLDGDNVRHGLNRDLGFTDAERVENIRRVAEVAKLMVDAGLIVLVSFISPFAAERRLAREKFEDGEFVEVFVDASLEAVERRDPKGLYKKAREGKISNFTGISSPYEAPENPELTIRSDFEAAEEAAEKIVDFLLR